MRSLRQRSALCSHFCLLSLVIQGVHALPKNEHVPLPTSKNADHHDKHHRLQPANKAPPHKSPKPDVAHHMPEQDAAIMKQPTFQLLSRKTFFPTRREPVDALPTVPKASGLSPMTASPQNQSSIAQMAYLMTLLRAYYAPLRQAISAAKRASPLPPPSPIPHIGSQARPPPAKSLNQSNRQNVAKVDQTAQNRNSRVLLPLSRREDHPTLPPPLPRREEHLKTVTLQKPNHFQSRGPAKPLSAQKPTTNTVPSRQTIVNSVAHRFNVTEPLKKPIFSVKMSHRPADEAKAPHTPPSSSIPIALPHSQTPGPREAASGTTPESNPAIPVPFTVPAQPKEHVNPAPLVREIRKHPGGRAVRRPPFTGEIPSRVQIRGHHPAMEEVLNSQIFALLRQMNVTSFIVKTNQGALRAAADPQMTWFVPVQPVGRQRVPTRGLREPEQQPDVFVKITNVNRGPTNQGFHQKNGYVPHRNPAYRTPIKPQNTYSADRSNVRRAPQKQTVQFKTNRPAPNRSQPKPKVTFTPMKKIGQGMNRYHAKVTL